MALGTNEKDSLNRYSWNDSYLLQNSEDSDTNDFLDFGDHTYNETFEATDDAKYVHGNWISRETSRVIDKHFHTIAVKIWIEP